MNAPPHLEVLRLRQDSPQTALPLATAGVERHVWESRFGAMLIEVIDGVAYVNGSRVVPAAPSARVGDGASDASSRHASSSAGPR